MTPTWNGWEGICLAGEYGLHEWLGESENAAFFRTGYGPNGQPAVLKLIPAESVSADTQLESWSHVSRLSHSRLLRLLDFGRTAQAGLSNKSLLYAVFEFPEETLAAALERGPLNEGEVGEIEEAAVEALRHLHSQGLVHTAIDAGHVVAVGNQIKLSSDTVREPCGDQTAAADWRQLEALLAELCPGRVMRLAEIGATPEPPEPASTQFFPPPRRSFPIWAYGALAVLLGGLGFVFLPKSTPPGPKGTGRAASLRPAPPALPAIAPAPTQPAPAREQWRVIVYTYSSYQAAAGRARSIGQKWPGAAAEVFAPNGAGRAPYLVALGGRMTRDEAVRLLKMARGKGLPRDTYIQNYSR